MKYQSLENENEKEWIFPEDMNVDEQAVVWNLPEDRDKLPENGAQADEQENVSLVDDKLGAWIVVYLKRS